MKYGKKITVSRQGFHIDANSLQTVGIGDGSRCRGILISRKKKKDKYKKKDLIISPFPFSSWGCIVTLQIRVKSNRSTKDFNKILKFIAKNKFNLLSINFAFGGYNHHTFNLIGELYKLRKDVEIIRKCSKKIKKNYLEHKFTQKIYKKMRNLKYDINNKFSNILYNQPNKSKDEYIRSVYWKWNRFLASNAFEINIKDPTLYFNYDAKKSLLSLENKDLGSKFIKDFSGDQNNLPILALAAFNSGNSHIKLRSLYKDSSGKQILQFDLSYFININKQNKKSKEIAEVNEYGSRGIIHKFLKSIINNTEKNNDGNFELTGISTKNLSRESTTKEKGLFSIYGILNQNKNKQELEILANNINNNLLENKSQPNNQEIYNLKVKIKNVYPYVVFISIRENFKARITSNLSNILNQEGFNTKTSGTYTAEITENVIQDMSLCDACIQIYSLSLEEIKKIKSDGEKTDFVPDNSWLLFEFGIARSKSMSIVRMIDVTHLNKKEWVQYLRTDNDKLLIEFDFNTDDMSLKNKIREAAQHLLKTLEKK